jgi:hypothetical protein
MKIDLISFTVRRVASGLLVLRIGRATGSSFQGPKRLSQMYIFLFFRNIRQLRF